MFIGDLHNVLSLLRAKCLPVLLYGVECCRMLTSDKRSLEFTVTPDHKPVRLRNYFGLVLLQ